MLASKKTLVLMLFKLLSNLKRVKMNNHWMLESILQKGFLVKELGITSSVRKKHFPFWEPECAKFCIFCKQSGSQSQNRIPVLFLLPIQSFQWSSTRQWNINWERTEQRNWCECFWQTMETELPFRFCTKWNDGGWARLYSFMLFRV